MAKKDTSFIFFKDWAVLIDSLNAEDRLYFWYLFSKCDTQAICEKETVKPMWNFIVSQLNKMQENYQTNIVERNQNNGKLGGRPSKDKGENPNNPMGFLKPKEPKLTQKTLNRIESNRIEDNKIETEQYINHFNSLFNKNYKPIKTIETALKYWLAIYTIDEIKQALTLSTKLDTFEAKICREEPIKLLRQSNKSGGVDYIGNLLNSTPTTNNDIIVTDIHKPMNDVTKKHLIDKHNLASDFFEWPMMEKLSHLARIKLDYQFNPKTASQ